MRGWPRNDTDDHGKKVDGVVLVLSKAVLVIVIDARAVGWTGLACAGGSRRRRGTDVWRAGFNTKDTELTKVF